MEEIEVNIKIKENNRIYNIPIRKSDTILRLKEYCKIISNIPQNQQNLIFKGKILSDEKLINDYNIDNNNDIFLVKKEDPKSVNISINKTSNNSNPNENFINIKNINFSNKKEINPNDVANAFKNAPNITSFYDNLDLNLMDKFFQIYGLGKFSDLFGVDQQNFKEMLKDPSARDMMNNMVKDPSLVEMSLNNPIVKEKIKNIPLLNFIFQNPNLMINPQSLQMTQNAFREKERNSIESSNVEISVPPDPFGSLNNNQINQMMNSSISIDYKEKYKEQLSQLKKMGFANEETNIQALKQSNGNIDNALDKLL